MQNFQKQNLQILQELRDLTLEGNFDARKILLWDKCEAIRHYLCSFQLDNAGAEFIHSYVNDALPRFFHTLDLMRFPPGLKVLELGANPYLFTILLHKIYSFKILLANFFNPNIYETKLTYAKQKIASSLYGEEYELEFANFNIESSSYPYEANSFDLILFCEILEHLIINPLGVFPKFKSILKPGGILLLTTPNAARLSNFAHFISGSNFFDRYHPEFTLYGRHNREFSCEEIRVLLETNGFEVLTLKTLDRYNYDIHNIQKDNYEIPGSLQYTRTELEELLKKISANLNDRGDNIYALARKSIVGSRE